jgi:hypothetical protein
VVLSSIEMYHHRERVDMHSEREYLLLGGDLGMMTTQLLLFYG